MRWEPIDTGSCPVEYNIQFTYNSKWLVTVQKINDTRKLICEKQYFNATNIVIWATTYNGYNGRKSAVNVKHFIPFTLPETTITTIRSGESYCYQNFCII